MPFRTVTFAACLVAAACAACPGVARAKGERDLPSEDKSSPPAPAGPGEEEWYSVHSQFTGITQAHPAFRALYTGQNSLQPGAEAATAFVTTLYGDLRLWPGGELLVNPEMSGGTGLSRTLGIAGFPNGIVYRVGNPAPAVYLARLAISQTFPLGGGKLVNEPGPNELQGTRDENQLAITVGRLSVTDVFDANRYANDPTAQFLNWALMVSGAWDYPADTRGYTWGALADLSWSWWSVRAGVALEPYYANLEQLDWRILKSHGLMAEYEARYSIGRMAGAWSLLFFLNSARMGSYEQVLADPAMYGNNIAETRADGRTKYGFAFSAEQQITKSIGAFLRLSWNDGHNESWAFTEIDQSLVLGAVLRGRMWRRPTDELGVAFIANGISPWHERYLAGGGYGFIIGDGALSYAPELIGEAYYRVRLTPSVSVAADYQPIINPAYNRDRGPVHTFGGRVHVAF